MGVCCKVSGACLVLLTVLLINPITTPANALESTKSASDNSEPTTQADTGTGRIKVSFTPTTVSGEMTPTTESGLKKQLEATATVSISNAENYEVYIGAATTALVGVNNSENKIASIQEATNYNDLPANSWGIYWGNGDSVPDNARYQPVEIGRGSKVDPGHKVTSNTSKQYAFGFAANINNQMPADTYQNQITLSVISSPLEMSNNFGIEYMQDMTASVCSGVAEGATDQLIDKRDGKSYWVTKLADGNCWMTQNLDLDIPAGGFPSGTTAVGSMSYQNSDMSAAWTNPTAATTSTLAAFSSSVYTESRSWDQGLYVLNTPEAGTNCGNSSAGQGLSNCSSAGFVNVTGYTASDDPDFTAKNGSPVNESTKTYDAHYLVGNWYQWTAATVGTGTDLSSTGSSGNVTSVANLKDAPSSICPNGWRLPTSGRGSSQYNTWNQDDSFGKLLSYYGWTGTSSVSGQNSMQTNTLAQSPLFFVRSGYVDYAGYLRDSGNNAFYWSSTAYTDTNSVYNFAFTTDTDVRPSYNATRFYGDSVRCLAR